MNLLVLVQLLTAFFVFGKPVDELKSRNAELLSTETVEDSLEGRLASPVSDENLFDLAKSNESEKESVRLTELQDDDSSRRFLNHSYDVSVQEQSENEVRSAAEKNVPYENFKSPVQHPKIYGVMLTNPRAFQNIETNDVDATANLSRRNYEQDGLEISHESLFRFENSENNSKLSGPTRRKEVEPSGEHDMNSKNHQQPVEGKIDSRTVKNLSGPLLLTVDNDEVTVAIEVLPDVRIGNGYDDKIHPIEARRQKIPGRHSEVISNIVPGYVDSLEPIASREASPDSNSDEKTRTGSLDDPEENYDSVTDHNPVDASFRKGDKPVKDILTDREHLLQKIPAVLPDDENITSDVRASNGSKDEENERGSTDVTEIIIPGTLNFLPITVTKVPDDEILPPISNNSDFVRLIRPDVSLLPDLGNSKSLRAGDDDVSRSGQNGDNISEYDINDRNAYPFSPTTPLNVRVPLERVLERHNFPENFAHQNYPSPGLERKPPNHFKPFNLTLNMPYTFGQAPIFKNTNPQFRPQYPTKFNPFKSNQTHAVPHLNNVPNRIHQPGVPVRNVPLESNLNSGVPLHQYKPIIGSPIEAQKYRFVPPLIHDVDNEYLENTPSPLHQHYSSPERNPVNFNLAPNQYRPLPAPPSPHSLNPYQHFQPYEGTKFPNNYSPDFRFDPTHPISDLSRNPLSFHLPLPSLPPFQSFKSYQPSQVVQPSSPNIFTDHFPNYINRPLPVTTPTAALPLPLTSPFAPFFRQAFITSPVSRSGFITRSIFN